MIQFYFSIFCPSAVTQKTVILLFSAVPIDESGEKFEGADLSSTNSPKDKSDPN